MRLPSGPIISAEFLSGYFPSQPIIVFFLLDYDNFVLLSWWANQAGGPGAAARHPNG